MTGDCSITGDFLLGTMSNTSDCRSRGAVSGARCFASFILNFRIGCIHSIAPFNAALAGDASLALLRLMFFVFSSIYQRCSATLPRERRIIDEVRNHRASRTIN
jgi:hypothetical protein